MKSVLLFSFLMFSMALQSQTFTRSELQTELTTPWEISYGQDNFLWLTEKGGKISRVNPSTGDKTIVFTASDYFSGSSLENSTECPNKGIGVGTLGMALHPDFMNPEKAYLFFVYSYNHGTAASPETKFRIKRLTWDATTNTVVSDTNIVDSITTGYDHIGGRLMAIKQNGITHLFLSIGDNGISEDSSPNCYVPQTENPNNYTQDISTQNGKIHRFNIDGSIPSDNPVAGNSFFTRGHRNPQGLMYNSDLDIIYDIEHGDRTDDEINILHKGMNYGWKNVRGFHNDGSFNGEEVYVSSYTPNPQVLNDSLVEPLYSWCTTPSTSSTWLDWCTVAPSGGIYYNHNGIHEWQNSLLVVTLKDGVSTNKEVYQFKLLENGQLAESTNENPNPKRFFSEHQDLNGRLRDIAVSTDGKSIYLINNGGTTDKITVYTVKEPVDISNDYEFEVFPNPVSSRLTVSGLEKYSDLKDIKITNLVGDYVNFKFENNKEIDVSTLAIGTYILHLFFEHQNYVLKFVKI